MEETKRSTKVNCGHCVLPSLPALTQAALESTSNQLMEKTRELANVQLEKEKLRVSVFKKVVKFNSVIIIIKASISATEEKLRGVESTAHMKVAIDTQKILVHIQNFDVRSQLHKLRSPNYKPVSLSLKA